MRGYRNLDNSKLGFQKGCISYHKDKIMSEEIKKKLSIAMKGKSKTLEHRNKISLGLKKAYLLGKRKDNKGKNSCMYGKHFSEETKKRISISVSGDKHHNWQGGKSFEPYGLQFNNQLKEYIRKKYNYRCQECFRHQDELNRKLSIHHIDFNKKNNNDNNLIPLCDNCHSQTLFNRDNWVNYFQNRIIV